MKDVIKNALLKTIPKYRDDLDLQSIIDFFQENVSCCLCIYLVDFKVMVRDEFAG